MKDVWLLTNPVDWGYRIHRLHLWSEVRPPYECPGNDAKQPDGEAPLMLELFRNGEYLFIAIAPQSTLTKRVAPDRVLFVGQIGLFHI